ncbi:hypothetical protein GCM10020221_15640 [Streptomyces thioluteus]|uniref:Restriction endonuclease domain-containing protein n=1 Tax=Streptomyces thioluteus TaxID=66431 RepID=A0ABN3WLE9_STRTU
MTAATRREIYRHLRSLAEHFTPPAPLSSHVEISDGQIVMMMSPAGRHDLAALRIERQLQPQLPPGIVATTSGDIEDADLGQLRRPTSSSCPRRPWTPMTPSARRPCSQLWKSSPLPIRRTTTRAKLRHYPRLGIPHYLIVDPRDGTCVHYWAITSKSGTSEYSARVPYTFGDKITHQRVGHRHR